MNDETDPGTATSPDDEGWEFIGDGYRRQRKITNAEITALSATIKAQEQADARAHGQDVDHSTDQTHDG